MEKNYISKKKSNKKQKKKIYNLGKLLDLDLKILYDEI